MCEKTWWHAYSKLVVLLEYGKRNQLLLSIFIITELKNEVFVANLVRYDS